MRDLFRELHTLKGLSAMVDLEPVVAIAHAMETVVRAVDRGATLEAPALERLFDAMRAVEQRLGALGRGEEPSDAPRALLDSLAAFEPAGAATPTPEAGSLELEPAIDRKLEGFERERLTGAAAEGQRAVRLEFSPSPRRAADGVTINTVRERVAAVAEIVKVVPLAVPPSEGAPSGLTFVLLAVTRADDAELAAALGGTVTYVPGLGAGRSADAVPGGAPQESPEGSDPADDEPAPDRRNVLRIEATRVDDALERLSSLIVTRSRMSHALTEIAGQGAPTRELWSIVHENARQLRDLRAAILRLRMVPFADLVARLAVVLRGLRRSSQKDVRLVSEATDAELDKAVADRVFPALVHLVRNAVDHGIEPAAERVRRGKPPHARVVVACSMHRDRQLEIRVSDDGRGIDREQVARASGEGAPDDDDALLDRICRPGLSTRGDVDATSGRGMGMDIARRIVVGQLGGELSLETRAGEGTTFTLRIPLTVAIVDAFTVQCDEQRFCIPVTTVEEIFELDPTAITHGPSLAGRDSAMIVRRGEAVPLVHLARALGRTDSSEERARHALVVRRGGEPLAFRLDRVIGQQETVVRPLVDPLVQVPGIVGSADLGDGRATLVLDLFSLAAALAGRRHAKERAA